MSAPVKVEVRSMPDDNVGYAKGTLDAMQRMTAAGVQDPTVQKIARSLVGSTTKETLENDWKYLKNRIAYLPDPVDRERVTSARFTVGQGVPGDCDDMSVAAATVLYLQNIPCHFEAIEWRTNSFTHVIVVVDLPGGKKIPFDLTMDFLGQEHPPTKTFPYEIMARVETIADRIERCHPIADAPPTTVQILVDKIAYGTMQEKQDALKALHMFYPQQVTQTYQWGHNVRTFNTDTRRTSAVKISPALTGAKLAPVPVKPGGPIPPRVNVSRVGDPGINDLWSWLGDAVSVVADVITGNWSAIPVVLAGGMKGPPESVQAPNPIDKLKNYLHSVTGVDQGVLRDPLQHPELYEMQDPRRPDRTITNYMTYLDELPQIMFSSYRPLGNMTIENNYSAVFTPIKMPNVPVFNALTQLSPELIFVSFDNETALLSPYVSISGQPVGQYGYKLSGLLAGGSIQDFPGYYTRTTFQDTRTGHPEGYRWDFVGMNPGDVPSTDNGTPQYDLTKCTAYMWLNQGIPPTSRITGTGDIQLPTATPQHVTVTPTGSNGQPITPDPGGKTDPASAAAIAFFKSGGGDAGYKSAMDAYLKAGGTLADAAGAIQKIISGGFAVTGAAPPLQNNATNWFSENWPIVAGAGAGLIALTFVLK